MSFKFNNGNGAVICDVCRVIMKAPATFEDSSPKADLCAKHNLPKNLRFDRELADACQHINVNRTTRQCLICLIVVDPED